MNLRNAALYLYTSITILNLSGEGERPHRNKQPEQFATLSDLRTPVMQPLQYTQSTFRL